MTSSLPEGWSIARIGDLIGAGGTFVDGDWVESKDQDPNGDVRLIQLADVGDGSYLNKSRRFLTSGKAKELRCTYLIPGDVLIARMPDPLGRACIFPGDPRPSVTVVDVCIVRTGSSGVNQRWLIWVINSPKFREAIAFLQSGSTRKRISRGNLATLTLPVAPIAEQQRIAEAIEEQFTRLDAAVAGLKRVRQQLKRYRASVLKAACEGRLVPTEAELARAEGREFEPADRLLERVLNERRARGGAKYKVPVGPSTAVLADLPDGWTRASSEQVGEVTLGRQRAPQHHFGPHMRPYLRAANVLDGRIDYSDVLSMNFTPDEFKKYELKPFDILLNEGQSLELVGRAAMYRGESPGTCFQKTLIRFRPSRGVVPAFALIVFRAYMHSGIFSRVSRWTTTMAHLTAERFLVLEFPLPPYAEQERIVAEVERRLSVVEKAEAAVEANLKRAERMRQAILKRAFEGKLVPQDPADEPASVLLERIRAEREQAAATAPKRRGRRSVLKAEHTGPERHRQLRFLPTEAG